SWWRLPRDYRSSAISKGVRYYGLVVDSLVRQLEWNEYLRSSMVSEHLLPRLSRNRLLRSRRSIWRFGYVARADREGPFRRNQSHSILSCEPCRIEAPVGY